MGCTPCAKRREAAAAAQRPRSYTGPAIRSGTSDGMTYSLVLRDGTEQRFGSRLEADAANARAGYTGVVRQKP